ncbi:hypothetical protein SAMN05216327_1206 [Dyadobacter sp. SG02]|uniref:hypothetical protein n=1 Tax=Dyadobacter sp. SG02 TaxID=1855291 RepID=UPI0008B01729|nr:hypothetical protein [Dyadobacter sp. SG02]SEJ78801.1 hypothetical protein SAMN05216327_1206 [Dyadobacter sp. SG02]
MDLKVAWIVLSEVRHAITHQQGRIEVSKVRLTKQHAWLFDWLFPSSYDCDGGSQITISYEDLKKSLEFIVSLAFMFFKAASISENLDWESFIKVPQKMNENSITIVEKISDEDSKAVSKLV